MDTLNEFPEKCRLFLRLPEFSQEMITRLSNEKTRQMLQQVAECIRGLEEFSLNGVEQCLKKAGKLTGLKGKGLYHPLRIALTGAESGPELVGIIRVLGREGTLQRLDHCLSQLLNTI